MGGDGESAGGSGDYGGMSTGDPDYGDYGGMSVGEADYGDYGGMSTGSPDYGFGSQSDSLSPGFSNINFSTGMTPGQLAMNAGMSYASKAAPALTGLLSGIFGFNPAVGVWAGSAISNALSGYSPSESIANAIGSSLGGPLGGFAGSIAGPVGSMVGSAYGQNVFGSLTDWDISQENQSGRGFSGSPELGFGNTKTFSPVSAVDNAIFMAQNEQKFNFPGMLPYNTNFYNLLHG